ncbi:MAG: DNA-directed RNA polymerase subunit omega [Clostridia bacterium]|nr:DNA-directed RNA polymerase subunit omega [Clostridia bacterium]
MYKPSIDDMLTGKESRYSLVIAVAKRAREITNEYNSRKEVCDDKTVLMAVNDFKEHKYEIIVDDSPEPKLAPPTEEKPADDNMLISEEQLDLSEDEPSDIQVDENGEVVNIDGADEDSNI